jgi:Predicted Zn peptidase
MIKGSRAWINKETFAHICTSIGVTSAFLAKKTTLAEDKINKWLSINEDTLPTIIQAKKIAKALKIPFAGLYMSKNSVNIKHLPKMRSLRTMPLGIAIDESALNLAIVDLIRARDFLVSSEEELGIEKNTVSLPILTSNVSVSDFARTIRSFFSLNLQDQFNCPSTRQFYLYLRRQIENHGIFINCFTDIDVKVARGIAIFDDDIPIIGINDNDRYPAKSFSIIHELVHIIKRQSVTCNEMFSSFSAQQEEVFCNAVAGEVLVSATALNAYLAANNLTDISLVEIETMAKRFNVSKEVITRRLLDTNHFTQDVYDIYTNEFRQNFESERQAQKIARQEGRAPKIAKVPSREAVDKNSSAICRVLLFGYGEGYFSKQDVSGVLGIKEKYISAFITEVVKW